MKSLPAIRPVEKAIFALYDLCWRLALPFLHRNRRLAEGFENRMLAEPLKSDVDIWIQAASAGEAYLAWELLKALPADRRLDMLLTTNTLQGKEILEKAVAQSAHCSDHVDAQVTYCPFDMPSIMQQAVRRANPRLVVLLETEIWPGLLWALKQRQCPAVIVNGRITEKSLSRYMLWPAFWRAIRPESILAVSKRDAKRFALLFGNAGVTTMPNIKFDRLKGGRGAGDPGNHIGSIIAPEAEFAVLGSVRREEENAVLSLLRDLKTRRPQAVVGLFPRHLHRVDHWRKALDRAGLAWVVRSSIVKPVTAGRVVLWDVFGELGSAYRRASAAFVGGSLAPLGGQNFLEPLVTGLTPVIGPHWKNFAWVGAGIVKLGLVHQAESWQDVSGILADCLAHPREKQAVVDQAADYIGKRQGGTKAAWGLIMQHL